MSFLWRFGYTIFLEIDVLLRLNQYFHNSYKFKGTNHTLDIVSWNIENFPKNDVTINEMIPIIDSLNVDIIALQEIESTQDFNNLVNQLGDNWIGYKAENSSYGVLSYLINTTFITIFFRGLLNMPFVK